MDKPIAWYDPSNGMVSTDQDCPLFTPLGQVWGLYPEREWVGLTDEDEIDWDGGDLKSLIKAIEKALKERNT
jgi:hypothetical protein